MSKMKRLLDVIEDLRSLADSLQALADGAVQSDALDAPTQAETTDAKETAEKTPRSKTKAKPTITLEDVRAVLSEKSRAGHTAEVRELIKAHGADKLPEIDKSEYAALLAEAEAL